METRLISALLLLAVPAVLSAQDSPPARLANPAGTLSADPPLPSGAVQRLGDTRFRPGARITHLAFSADGKRLASWGNWMNFEDRISVWEAETGREVYTQPMIEGQLADLAWGASGGFTLLSKANEFRVGFFADASGKHPPSVNPPVVKEQAFQPKVVIPVPMAPTYELITLSPCGTRIAAFRSGGLPVQLFAAKAGATSSDMKIVATSGPIPAGKCTGLRFTRGNNAVVILTENEKAQSAVIWDTQKETMSSPMTVPMGVRQGNRQSLDVADDGSSLAIGLEDGTIKVFDLPSGKERLSVRKHDGPKHGGRWSEVSAVKFVNGGRQVLSAGRDNQQVVWDAKTGMDVAALNGHGSWVEAVAISPEGNRVATAGQDSLIRLWDASTWKPIVPPEGPRGTIWRLDVSRDGKYVAAASGTEVHVWNRSSGRQVRSVPSHQQSGYVLFSAEGTLLVGNGEGSLFEYPMAAGEKKVLKAKGKLLDFSPDGKTLLTGEGATVILWDWPACTQRRVVSLRGEALSATCSPDGRKAVIGLSGKTSAILDLVSGAVEELPIKLHWFARAAGFAAGGRVMCGTVGDSQAEAWAVASRSLLRKFEQPLAPPRGHFYMTGFAVSSDGRKAASCHSDGGVAVYETATGQIIAHFQGHRDSAISVAWAGNDRVLSAGSDHQVLVWDVSLHRLAGKGTPMSAADRIKAWDQLGSQPVKEAMKTMVDLTADPEGTVALIAERLKPIQAADPATLDKIFLGLDDKAFVVREKASRALSRLDAGAIAGVRHRLAKNSSEEVRGRVEGFLKQFDAEIFTPERIRYLRALEVLAAMPTVGRKVVEGLTGGAEDVWETEVARQSLRGLPGRPMPN